MDTMYQRSKIQEESLYYERLKHSGELPLIGVNTFLPRDGHGEQIDELELMRSTDAEKQVQIANVRAFQARAADRRPEALARLQDVARDARQRVRGADGGRQGRLARPDLAGALRGRR